MREKLIELINNRSINVKILFERYVESEGKIPFQIFQQAIQMYAQHKGVIELYRWGMIEHNINILIIEDGLYKAY